MKKILIALLLLPFAVNAQTVHYDTASQCGYVFIDSFKAKFNDVNYSSRLYVKSVSDNLATMCQLYYELRDYAGNVTMRANAVIDSANYQNWNGSNTYPFNFVADSILKINVKN